MRLTILLLFATLLTAAEIRLDSSKLGRVYEGIGALSAGASSKLLIDYPEPQRSQILDLLFKPGYGAALQHLKVEIGGDVNSTCGTEPALAHTREEFLHPKPEYFDRGYERWLVTEAHRRSPAIIFDALQWGAPAWIGNGKFYSQDNADLIAAFHRDLRDNLGIRAAYQGIWNETLYDTAWIKLLRRTLDGNGLERVLIGAADQTKDVDKWRIAEDAARDPELARAIHAFGDHYLSYQSSEAALRSGKPLWAAEDGPWAGDWLGATKLAKLFNRNYIDGRLTRTITWALISSYYDILPVPGAGLMRAVEPWSGHFEIQPALWAAAHTTQFTAPGWRYVDGGCGRLEPQGSYVTLFSPDRQDFSLIVETMDSPYIGRGRPREFVFRLDAGFPRKPVHVWRSSAQEQFIDLGTVEPVDGLLRYKLGGDSIYTFSTLAGPHKGGMELSIPESRVLPLPYTDNFDRKPAHSLPRYFIDQSGVFEAADRPDGRGACLRQVVPVKGIDWIFHPNPEPYTLMGDGRWRDYQVEVDTLMDGPGTVSVHGRITNVSSKAEPPAGYWLSIDQQGAWKLYRKADVLATGKTKFVSNTWQTIGLRFAGERITALVNGRAIATVTDSRYPNGLAGFGCGWQRPWFDNFRVLPVPR